MSKITIKRSEIGKIFSALAAMTGSYTPKLKYAIKKNKDLLKPEIEALLEAEKTNVKGFEDCQKEFNELVENCKGNDTIINTDFGMVKLAKNKVEKFKVLMDNILTKYEKSIKEREQEVEKINEFMKEEVKIDVFKISVKWIPDDINQNTFENLFPLFKESTQEIEKIFCD